MRIKMLVSVVLLCFMSQSFAGLLVDPYAGFGQSKSTFDLASRSDDTRTLTSLGSRLGFSLLLLSAGVDYQMSNTSYDGDAVKSTNMSFFVGFDLPILIRGWAEYFVSSKLELDDGSDLDFDFKDGYGVGLGFTGLPFISVNLEVDLLNYDFDLAGSKVDNSVASTLLSVSLPLDF